MATNQGLLQAQIKVKNTIDLNNAFSSPSVANPQLKSIEGELNLSNEYALQNFNNSNTNTQHIDTIRTNSSNTSLKEALNNLPNLQYVRLEGNYESKGNSFDNNTNLQKVDLSESLQVKPEDFKANENLKTLPNLDYSNPDLTDIITNDTNLLPTTFDISNESNTNKLGIHGDSTHQLGNLEFVKVNPEAPFDNQITPQINVSYTSLNQNGLVNLFNTMPYNVGYEVVGSPTIVDGIASGFSNKTNYLTASTLTVRDLAKSEFAWKLNCNGSSIPVFSIGSNSGLWVYVMTPNIVRVKIGDDARYDFTLPSTFNLTDNFFYKITLENYVCSLYFGSTKESMTLIDTHTFAPTNPTASGALRIGSENWNWNSGTNFAGSIDLNETYIKINSQVSTGPIGYTVVGSPTIVDGVCSGFSTSNFLRFSSIFPDITNSDAEIIITLNNAGDGSSQGFGNVMILNNLSIALTNNGSPALNIKTRKTGETSYITRNVYDFGIVPSDGKYVLKFTKEANLLRIQGSRNGTTFSAGNTYTLEEGEQIQPSSIVGDIMCANRWSSLGTQMDLNETYIKVNGKLWFGHESKQVTWFNGKSSQIKIVDVSGATGTSSLTNDNKDIVTNKGWRLVTDGSNSKNYIIEDGKLVWANPNIYLESDGNSYIDTGIKANSNLKIDTLFKPKNDNVFGFFGSIDNINKSFSAAGMFTATPFLRIGEGTCSGNTAKDNRIFNRLIMLNSFNDTTINNTNMTTNNSYGSSTFSDGGDIWLFGINGRGPGSQQFKYFKIYQNNGLILHLVPVPQGLIIGSYTIPSNGMFDIVNQQFYANQGTGQFTCGWDLE